MLHARMFNETVRFRDSHFQPLRASLSTQHALPASFSPSSLFLDGNVALDRPLTVQFCANDPDEFLSAARYVAPFCDAVDLNLGCPQGIARKGKYGAFLQEDQDLIFGLINKLHVNLEVPITAKIRILETKKKTLEYARLVLRAGASILTVHGRHRDQKGHKTGLADWNVIRYLRDNLPPETVLFANGNILKREDIDACIAATAADGVMSAEGNLYDPAIFAEEPAPGDEGREFWRGRDGRGGWRMDAVFRRYMDILYKYVLEVPLPDRKPLYLPSDPVEASKIEGGEQVLEEREEGPPRKKQKKEKKEKTTSPNLLAMQPHLFRLLRPLVARHHHIRDALARCRAGDIEAFETILQMVERAVKVGLKDYEDTNGRSYEDELEREDVERLRKVAETTDKGEGKEQIEGQQDDQAYESSLETVKLCRRPWWVIQPYVRPLPREALAKGSLTLSKKEKEEAARLESRGAEVKKVEGMMRDEDGVPKGYTEVETAGELKNGVEIVEVAKEGLVCG